MKDLTSQIEQLYKEGNVDELSYKRYLLWLEDHSKLVNIEKLLTDTMKRVEKLETNHIKHIQEDVYTLGLKVEQLRKLYADKQ